MRQPCGVLVFPFRLTVNGPRYGIFQRADDRTALWELDARIRGNDLPEPMR